MAGTPYSTLQLEAIVKRSNDKTVKRVYAYGGRAPIDGWAEALAEADRQRALWNRLVDIERAHDERVHAQAARDEPAVATVKERIKTLSERIGAFIDERRGLRAKAREKVATPIIDGELDRLVPERRAQRKELWRLLAAWRKEHKDTMRSIETERREAVRDARRQSGCYWANYNRVIQAYDGARQAARRQGRRLRHFDSAREDGILTCQIQRTQSGVGAAFGELFGAVSAVRIEPVPAAAHDRATSRGERRRLCRTTVTLRVDAAGNTVTLPINLHRPVPEGMRIKSVALNWRREGERLRFQLCLTVSGPDESIAHSSTSACGVDLGWRLEDDGSLLVATVASTAGPIKRYTLPADWMQGMDQVERLSRHIDQETLRLAEQMHGTELPEALSEPLRRWRPGLGARHVDYAALHDAVRARHFDVPEPIRRWYDRYRHLLVWRDHLRVKLLRRRREIYRLIARAIVTRHALIALDTLDLARMARTKKRDDGSDPELHTLARAQRQRACIHELRSAIQHQAAKHGAGVTEVNGPSTMCCGFCDFENQPNNRAKRIWECQGCGSTWDQDQNAAVNLLADLTALGPVAPAMLPPKINMVRGHRRGQS